MATVSQETGVIELASGVFAKIFPEGRTNSGFIVGDEGVMVIDSLMTPSLARGIIEDVKKVTAKPVRYLVNTHYHGDHTFGNEVFAPVPIIAHANCRVELEEFGEVSIQRFSQMRPELAEELKEVRIRLPELTFQDSLTLYFGGRRLEFCYFGPGHTKGDIVIHLPEERVLYAGDLLAARMCPAMMDGRIGSWIDVVKKLDALPADAIVPGHGLMATKQELADEQEFLAHIWQGAAAAFQAGKSEDEAYASLKVQERWGSWPRVEGARIGVGRAYRELRGELK